MYLFGIVEALASQVTQENFDRGLIYPPFTNIRKISAQIAANVAAKAYELGGLFLSFLSPPIPSLSFHSFVSLLFFLACVPNRFGNSPPSATGSCEICWELYVQPHIPKLLVNQRVWLYPTLSYIYLLWWCTFVPHMSLLSWQVLLGACNWMDYT